MRDVVFARGNVGIPRVVRDHGVLRIELAAGADANHDPRTFTFPVEEAHLAVIRDDLTRHLLLWSALLPLCDAAGTRGVLDEDAAEGGSDPEHRVEYGLVDGMDGYRILVRAFVSGGCAALDRHGPWLTDVAEFEQARRRRDSAGR